MRALITPALASIALLTLAGCETTGRVPAAPQPEISYQQLDRENEFMNANYKAVTALMASYSQASGSANNAPFLVTTLVNIDHLDQSSTFGRQVSEHMASRITQLGNPVIELKVRNGVYMKNNEGEFLLTREVKQVARTHQAQAIVVGTYAVSSSVVYVNLKLVDPGSSIILAAHDYALPLNQQIRSLLGRGKAF